jgi:hypothetical protein
MYEKSTMRPTNTFGEKKGFKKNYPLNNFINKPLVKSSTVLVFFKFWKYKLEKMITIYLICLIN